MEKMPFSQNISFPCRKYQSFMKQLQLEGKCFWFEDAAVIWNCLLFDEIVPFWELVFPPALQALQPQGRGGRCTVDASREQSYHSWRTSAFKLKVQVTNLPRNETTLLVGNRSDNIFMHAEPVIHVLSAYTASKWNLAPCRYTEIFAWGSVISKLLSCPITWPVC